MSKTASTAPAKPRRKRTRTPAIRKRADEAVKQARKMADDDGVEFDEAAVLRPYEREIAALPNPGDSRHDGGRGFVNSLAGKLGVSPTASETVSAPAGKQPGRP